MDTESLRWFQQVVDGVTVTEVSEIEGVSQPGVSRALARLESEIGTPLLQRAGRVLRPTLAGQTFKRHVDALLHQLDDGLAAVNQVIDPETGTVGLAFAISLGTWLVPDLVSVFRREWPDIRFELTQVSDDRIDAALSDGTADLAVSTARSADSRVERQPLLLEPLRLAVPAAHRLADRSAVGLVDVADESFLMLRSSSLLRTVTDELCRAAGFAPRVGFEGADVHTLRGFVAAGLGGAVVPAAGESLPETPLGPVRYLPLTDAGASREIGLAWSVDRRLLPAVRLFRDHVVDRAKRRELPPAGGTSAGGNPVV